MLEFNGRVARNLGLRRDVLLADKQREPQPPVRLGWLGVDLWRRCSSVPESN